MTSNTDQYKLFKLKVEPEISLKIQQLLDLSDSNLKTDLVSDAAEWFIKERLNGGLPARYFASPTDAPTTVFWIRKDTAKHIQELAETDNQKGNRVIYTALARFIEKQ
ncbi:hypothetical protein F4826_004741 [Rahnella inusitata]|nr:hypothetical protein [Rahnella inusitata]